METRAKFVLIGAFTVAGLLGILGFFLWFARIELDRQFDYYDIRFSSVSGLGNASDVRFAGLPVGQVVDVRLSPERDGTILVRVEVDAATPVRADSQATIEAQGVTGVSFVGIDAGTPEAPLLEATADDPTPEITAGRSALQSLTEDAPRLLEQSLQVVEEIDAFLGPENQARVSAILGNIELASAEFARSLQDFSAVSETVADFAAQIGQFNALLEELSGEFTDVLDTADRTILSIGELSEDGKSVLADSAETLASARSAIARAEAFVEGEMTLTMTDLRETGADLRRQLDALSDDLRKDFAALSTALQAEASGLATETRGVLATVATAGAAATARLQEAQGTLSAADALIARLDSTADGFGQAVARVDRLIAEEGAPLLSETRAMVAEADRAVASVTEIATADLPAIVADIRNAAETARGTITEVGDSLRGSATSAEAVLATAGTTLAEAGIAFANANDTLAAINAALETGDRALIAAERAFVGADRVINDDIDGIVAGLESTLAALQGAIGQVSRELPAISDDVRAASRSANDTFAELRRITTASAPALREFTGTTLPLFGRLAQESRVLIGNLDRLTGQIQRDPARFFLNRSTPEYRR